MPNDESISDFKKGTADDDCEYKVFNDPNDLSSYAVATDSP